MGYENSIVEGAEFGLVAFLGGALINTLVGVTSGLALQTGGIFVGIVPLVFTLAGVVAGFMSGRKKDKVLAASASA